MKKSYLSILLSIFIAAFFVGCGEKSSSLEDAAKEAAEQSEDAAKEAEKAAESLTK